MTKENIWVAALAMPVVVALLLMAGSPSVMADQPSAASADVKIDNFSFGPQTITVGVGTTVVQVVSCAAVAVETFGKVNRATRSTALPATPLVMLHFARLAAQGVRFLSKTWRPFMAQAISVLPQSASG